MFHLKNTPLYLFVDFGCQTCVPGAAPQLHPGVKVEFICLGTWYVMKEEKRKVPRQHGAREEF